MQHTHPAAVTAAEHSALMAVHNVDAPAYGSDMAPAWLADSIVISTSDDAIVARALAILQDRMRKPGAALNAPADARNLFILRAAEHTHREVFTVAFVDALHRVIEVRDMFFGTLTQTSVYPREIVRAAMELSASAVILSHNHPSGSLEPSRADQALTKRLKEALELVDVRVLDHVIVSGGSSLSMAEQGLV